MGVLEACLQQCRLEGFEGGETSLAGTELVSVGKGGIKIPYNTLGQVGRGGINEDCLEVLSK